MTQIQKEVRALEEERKILFNILNDNRIGSEGVMRVGYRLRDIHDSIIKLVLPPPAPPVVRKTLFQKLRFWK